MSTGPTAAVSAFADPVPDPVSGLVSGPGVTSAAGSGDVALLHHLGKLVRPTALASERVLPVAAPLDLLFPWGGLARGSLIATEGRGAAVSLALAVAAGASRAGAWVGAVGLPWLGWEASLELGLDLQRVVAIDPPSTRWAEATAALVDAVEVVVIGGSCAVGARDARRLSARARERGSVLLRPDGAWPETPDLTLTVTRVVWSGTDEGHGHLRHRRITLSVEGRRSAARRREVDLWLPGPVGPVGLVDQPVGLVDQPERLATVVRLGHR